MGRLPSSPVGAKASSGDCRAPSSGRRAGRHLRAAPRAAGPSTTGNQGRYGPGHPRGGGRRTVPGDLERLVNTTIEQLGDIHILVNNAGRSAAQSLLTANDAYWQEDLDLKLMAAIRLTRLVVPSMRRVGGGAIVNMTTPGGKAPPAESVPPSVSRAAGIALTKAASKEFGRDGIRVNTVCIGSIKSMQIIRQAPSRRPAGRGAVRGSGLERAAGPHWRS